MSSKPIWRKVLWWLGIAISFNLALFLFLPKIASFFVERQFEAFGLKNVNVELEYPGVRETMIPLISFQKDMGSETASLIVRDLTLKYDLRQLLLGFIKEVRIEKLRLDITGVPTQPPAAPTTKNSVQSTTAPLALLSTPLPNLPFEIFSLNHATIFREQATGPLRRVTISGLLRNDQGTLHGTVTFQGTQGDAYTLQAHINPLGKIKVDLSTGPDNTTPLFDMESLMNVQNPSGLEWQGRMTANLKRASPFLALLMPIGPDLERVNGSIEVQWDGSTNQMASLQEMLHDASTRLHSTIHAHVELPAWGTVSEDILLNFSGELHAQSTEVTLDIAPTSFMKAFLHTDGFPWPDALPIANFKDREPIRLQFLDIVHARMVLDKGESRWSIDGPLQIQYGGEPAPIGGEVILTNASGLLFDPLSTEANATFSLWGSLPNLEHQTSRVRDINWMMKGQTAFANQEIRVTIAEDSLVNTGVIHLAEGQAERMGFRLAQPTLIHYDWPLRQWKVEPTTAQIILPKIQWRDQLISIAKISLDLKEAIGEGQTWNTTGTAKLLGVNTKMKNFSPPSLNLAIGFDSSPEELNAGLVAETTDKTLRAKGRIEHHLQTHQGTLQATFTPETFSPNSTTLAHWFQPWPHPFNITSGQLGISIACGWKPSSPGDIQSLGITRGDVTLALKHIGGFYEKILIDNVNTTIKIIGNDLNNFATLSPAHVTIGSVNSGIKVTNMDFGLNLRLGQGDTVPIIDVEKFSAEALGGYLSSTSVYIDWARGPSLFTLKLERIHVDRLLQLEQQKGLEGTGILDGVVPITLAPDSIEIHDGRIEARAPGGVIHFQPLEDTAQSLINATPQMEIVLQSLKNFHYDVLKANVNYEADGTLTLATKLEGRNPDLKQGRPIHFNLNIEENIPALLKSLRVLKGIEDKIEKLFQGPLF
ncbi:YdbH domain-containing protein [Candidatus Nitronereus thalassa]|uniref:YdbH domain-containing protein n=1 Tax=Candidatus Nitronereus thalassa TaxID=3020898 RepID=A0ABU3K7S3_9BACT|nr:YdbH domain-containing protein [Candidatus Nitronereus thalassa]MDT7042494.1 YdbH domain-containing protein [Candidatus Nitronereus thalassa]